MNEFTIGRIVDAFREYLRQISDDSVYTDEYLFFILNICRNDLIKKHLDQNRDLSPWLYQRFCIKLCPSTFIECNCEAFDFGCQIYRSDKPIPRPLWDGDTAIMNVSELYGSIVTPVRETSNRFVKYRKFKRKMHYLIGDVNGDKYMFIMTTTTPPRYLKIEGVFYDPTSVAASACTDAECMRLQDSGFPIEPDKLNDLFKMAVDHLVNNMKMNEDRSNNSSSTLGSQQM